jgi:hypothetical protein
VAPVPPNCCWNRRRKSRIGSEALSSSLSPALSASSTPADTWRMPFTLMLTTAAP